MKEHQACVRKGDSDKSALAEHTESTGHAIHWCETEILQSESRKDQRRWSEACFIAKKKHVLFSRDSGRKLPGNYSAILNTK